jgi:hypothetical protein
MTLLRSLKNLLTTGSRAPVEEGAPGEGLRDADLDAGAEAAAEAAMGSFHTAGPGYPPGYVKDYDEGRPRH